MKESTICKIEGYGYKKAFLTDFLDRKIRTTGIFLTVIYPELT